MFRSRFLLTAAVAVAVALLAPAASEATFTVTLKVGDGSGSKTLVITDDDSNDSSALDGRIRLGGVDGVVPGPTVTGSEFVFQGYHIALTSMAWSTTTTAELSSTTDIVIKNVSESSGDTAETLTITITENNFTQPVGNGNYLLTNTLTADNWYNAAGATSTAGGGSVAAFATASPDLSTTDEVKLFQSAGTDSGVTFANFNKTNTPFSLSQQLTLVLSDGESVKFQSSSMILAPAPAGLVMVAGALPFVGFGLIRRRLRKGEPVTAA